MKAGFLKSFSKDIDGIQAKLQKQQEMKTYSLEELTDEYIGGKGSKKREDFEKELRLDLLGQTIKQVRLARNMTQEQLGELVGVKKAQISKIENSMTDARFETILKVFKALDAKINFNVEINKRKFAY
jgi:DNA-binding XRE family transcriptional regulator